MNKCCAIILNWNNYKDTKECIDSIVNSTKKVDQIIIVDNASTDGSSVRLKKEYENIAILYNDSNIGFAAGINVGIREALKHGYKYILLINNDAVLNGNCISELCKAFEESSNNGIVGPRIYYNARKDIVWQGGGYFSLITGGNVVPEKNRKGRQIYYKKYNNVSFLTGCVMLIKSELFRKIGLFNERIFFYEEDVDFCLRALKGGYKLVYVPCAVAWHKVEGIKITEFAFYQRARSRIIVLRDNFNVSYFIYGIFMHIIYYTPYKLIQSISKLSFRPFWAWIMGSFAGLKASRKLFR